MTVRIYRRRSKNDEGKQQFSLDVQAGDQPSGTLAPTLSRYGRVTVGVRFKPDSPEAVPRNLVHSVQ